MMYGELGRYPIYIDIKIRTVCYWARLIVGKQTKYSNVLYRLCRQLNENHNMQFSWILFVKLRDYYMTFSISALVLARDSHIKPDSETGGLIWVKG
jgi:hypothetical protein